MKSIYRYSGFIVPVQGQLLSLSAPNCCRAARLEKEILLSSMNRCSIRIHFVVVARHRTAFRHDDEKVMDELTSYDRQDQQLASDTSDYTAALFEGQANFWSSLEQPYTNAVPDRAADN